MTGADLFEPRVLAAQYAIRAARLVTSDDEDYGKGGPAAVLGELRKLKGELAKVQPTDLREDVAAFPRLEHIRTHVDNLIASGTAPGAPELWTLSAAIDRLAGMGDSDRG